MHHACVRRIDAPAYGLVWDAYDASSLPQAWRGRRGGAPCHEQRILPHHCVELLPVEEADHLHGRPRPELSRRCCIVPCARRWPGGRTWGVRRRDACVRSPRVRTSPITRVGGWTGSHPGVVVRELVVEVRQHALGLVCAPRVSRACVRTHSPPPSRRAVNPGMLIPWRGRGAEEVRGVASESTG